MASMKTGLVGTLAALAAAGPISHRQTATIPQYVLDYAPIVHLHSQDPYHPSDITAQLDNTHPELNLTDVPSGSYPSPLTLSNLDSLNSITNSSDGSFIYLGTSGNYTSLPSWLDGVAPDESGALPSGNHASAIVVHDKSDVGTPGIVDAYYFYFYAYNQGNTVLFNELGDHLGDWEHTMIRFNNSAPQAVWYSQHEFGDAYTYSAVEKYLNETRPVAYSANGTHANWATNGTHDHTIPDVVFPEGPLVDVTDPGPIWDITKDAYMYSVTFPSGTKNGDKNAEPTFTAYNGQDPTQWLLFKGAFGDDTLADDDSRQHTFFGQKKYTGGPTGPRDKDLNREDVCPQGNFPCVVRDSLDEGS